MANSKLLVILVAFPWVLFTFAVHQDNSQEWQLGKTSVLERSRHMFHNPLMSDVRFTFEESESSGQKRKKFFYAHKYVLATSSPVFYTMFYGDTFSSNSVIDFPGADKESLETFLRFIYMDECPTKPELALKVMRLTKTYRIPSFIITCVEHLGRIISPVHAFEFIEQSLERDGEVMADKCWESVDAFTDEALDSDAFLNIKHKTLNDLLDRDTLTSNETTIFKAVLKWADHQCLIRRLKTTRENRRIVLGDAIYRIRFPSMSHEEFSQYVIPVGLLTDDEVVSVLKKLSGWDVPNLKWAQSQRRPNFTIEQITSVLGAILLVFMGIGLKRYTRETVYVCSRCGHYFRRY